MYSVRQIALRVAWFQVDHSLAVGVTRWRWSDRNRRTRRSCAQAQFVYKAELCQIPLPWVGWHWWWLGNGFVSSHWCSSYRFVVAGSRNAGYIRAVIINTSMSEGSEGIYSTKLGGKGLKPVGECLSRDHIITDIFMELHGNTKWGLIGHLVVRISSTITNFNRFKTMTFKRIYFPDRSLLQDGEFVFN